MGKMTFRTFLILGFILLFSGTLFPILAAGKKAILFSAQGLTPRSRAEADRWNPPSYMWNLERDYEKIHPDVDIQRHVQLYQVVTSPSKSRGSRP